MYHTIITFIDRATRVGSCKDDQLDWQMCCFSHHRCDRSKWNLLFYQQTSNTHAAFMRLNMLQTILWHNYMNVYVYTHTCVWNRYWTLKSSKKSSNTLQLHPVLEYNECNDLTSTSQDLHLYVDDQQRYFLFCLGHHFWVTTNQAIIIFGKSSAMSQGWRIVIFGKLSAMSQGWRIVIFGKSSAMSL